MRRFWPILILALLPLLPLWRCVFQGQAIGPFDQIRQMAPWNGPKPVEPWDVLQADGVLQFYPWRDMVLKDWSSGRLPLWNPYELGGTPLLANSQSAGFYPPHIALGLLHVPTPAAMLLLAWFHLFWSGFGVYVLAKRMGASKQGAFVAGSTFELSAFMLAWTALPSVITTVAWIPWVLASVASLFYLPDRISNGISEVDSYAARRHQHGWTLMLAFSTAMLILAGHLQFVAYGIGTSLLFTIGLWLARTADLRSERLHSKAEKHAGTDWRVADGMAEKTSKTLLRWVLATGLAFLMGAPQLLPVLRYSQFSHRRNGPSAAGYEAYVAGSIKPFELANVADAYALGSPRVPVDIGKGQTISGYWPPLVKQGANLAESAVTVGPLVPALLFLVPWRERRCQVLAAVAVLALLLALGTALNWPLYFFLPGWSSTGSPGRIVVVFVMCSCILAGLGMNDRSSVPARLRLLAVAAPVVLSFVFLAFGQMASNGVPLAGLATSGALPSLTLTALLAAGGTSTLLFPAAAKYRRALLVLPTLLAVAVYAMNLVPTGQPISIQRPKDFARVAYVNQPWSLLTAAPALAPPNTAYLLGTHEIAGYDSLLHRDTKAMLDEVNGGDSAPEANGNMMFVKPTADPGRLTEAGVSVVWSRKPLSQFGQATAEDGLVRYDLKGSGRVSSPVGEGVVLQETSSSLRVRAAGPGRLIVRDRNMPGWLAKVDGRHVSMTGSIWREVDLASGDHLIDFNYVPPGLLIGVAMGAPAWLLVLLMAGCHVARLRVRAKPVG